MGRRLPISGIAARVFAMAIGGAVSDARLKGGDGAQWLQTHWQSEQGLPSNTVHAIVQTRDGYIWIGTKRGLARFDGVRFTVFKGGEIAGLLDSSVSALCETPDGALWIGGERGGVSRYHKGKFTALKQNVAAARWVLSIQPSRHADLLIRSASQLIAVKDGAATAMLPHDGVPDNLISGSLEDRKGRLWLGTQDGGLVRFDDAALSSHARFNVGGRRRVTQIFEDRQGQIWLGTGGALVRYDGTTFHRLPFDRASAFNEVAAIRQDLEGAIWAGVWGRVIHWKNGRFSVIPLKDGGADNEVLALAVDRENNVWAGTRNHGLYRLTSPRLLTYTKQEGLSNDSVKSVLADRAGRVWVGADVGLNILDNGRFRVVEGPLARHNVRSLAEDRDGSIWVGGWNRIYRLQKGGIRSISLNRSGLPAQVTTCLLPARDGSLWIGSRMGLLRWRNGVLTRITTRDGLSSDFIRAAIETRDGAIWVATSQGGLNRLKDGRITSLTVDDGLSSNDIYSLYEDADGVLWMGTMEHGLCRWKNGAIACFSAADGLFDDGAYQILEDRRGNLWIGGGGGIYRVAKRDLEARAAGSTAKITFIAFGQSDGMLSVECRGGHQPASGKTPDGRLWFATIRGLVVVDPERLRTNTMAPPVVIEEVMVNGEIRGAPAIEAPLGDGRVEIRYAGLSFVAPAKVRFKYRLDGFDRDWVSADNRRVASYTNLPPGRFEFRVLASNNDGVWNDTGAAFSLILKPPFYRSNWFLTLGAVLAAGLILAIHRYKVALMQARFAAVLSERARIAREIHDTIMQGMTGISAQLEAVAGVLSDSPPAARMQVDRVRNQARTIVEEARRSIWNLRRKTQDDGRLVNALRSSAREITEGSEVRYQIEVSGEHRSLPVPVEENLLRIAQEAIANAVQHGSPSCVRISLRFAPDCVRLIVEDDGQGFDPATTNGAASGHYGLVGMRERSDQMSARLLLQSSPGLGTRIEVSVPQRRQVWVRRAG